MDHSSSSGRSVTEPTRCSLLCSAALRPETRRSEGSDPVGSLRERAHQSQHPGRRLRQLREGPRSHLVGRRGAR
ncbi:hypothetical protein ACFPRL_01565 [Pseudoclavibacter helvolus]